MPNKLTDKEIKKALEEYVDFADFQHTEYTTIRIDVLKNALDLINRQEGENEKNENIIRFADKTIETLKAEVERLKNAYKQCAWERDIFAEDMTQEIKKDCSYLMLDIKTIKAEAYKEAFDKVKEELKNIAKIDWQGGYYYLVGEAFFDNLLNELVGGNNE